MSISTLFARGLVYELVSRKLDGCELLRRSRIDKARLSDLRDTLTLEETRVIVQHAIAMTGDPGIGLCAGAGAPEHTLQLFSHLILAQGTIRDVVAALTRYGSLLADGTTWSLVEHDDRALFVCTTVLPDSDLSRVLMDYTLSFTVNIGRHFFPPGERLHAVHFRHAAPSYAERYEPLLQCSVRFGQEHNATVFAREVLDSPQLHADSTLCTMLSESAERMLRERERERSTRDCVRQLLRMERDLATVDIRAVARSLKVSIHTLRRRLNAEGTSFSGLLDDARRDLACHELARKDATIQQTADLLGFSEPSAFFRAFKRWTGQTPNEFRRSKRAAAAPAPAIEPAMHG
ncbi:MAG: AraC family transcriptional regulator [Polyangiales bacterium]